MNKLILCSALFMAGVSETPALAPVFAQTYINIVDEDLSNLGINPLTLNADSKKIIAVTDKHDSESGINYLIFFVQDKDLIQEIKSINITTKVANSVSEFENANSSTKRYSCALIATSSNGLIHKYACEIDSNISSYLCKQYTFGRATLENGESRSYPLTATFDGKNYQYSITDTIELKNTKAASIYLEEHNDIVQGFLGSRGKNNIMYGLSVENYDINQLEEIEFIYDLYKFEAMASGDQVLWVEQIKTSGGFFDENYINSNLFKTHGVTYTDEELKEIAKYYPDYYELVQSGYSSTISNTSYTTKTYGLFKHNTYKWDSIIKMSDLENHASKETAQLIKDSFPDQEFVVTLASYDVEKKQDSYRSDKAHLCQMAKDMLHKYFGDKKRDPRYYWLQDKYGITTDYPSYNCIYFNSLAPKNIEVVRMKFIDDEENPYDLSVITEPIDISLFTGDKNSEKGIDDWFKELINNFLNWLKKNKWVIGLAIGILAALFLLPLLLTFVNLIKELFR